MNLVIDSGNTLLKAAIYDGVVLQQKAVLTRPSELVRFLTDKTVTDVLVSSVNYPADQILSYLTVPGKSIILTPKLPLPIKIKYATPDSLGVDRIAAVCGAWDAHPHSNCLAIDAGTCITYDFIDHEGSYYGGGISPGIAMRFEAMHTFTSRLPLVKPLYSAELIGNSTESCLQSGVMHGVLAEIEGIIEEYKLKYPDLQVILCGGDTSFFENRVKHPIFVTPDLVLSGLNRILRYHVEL